MYKNKKHNYPLYRVNPLTDLRDLVDGAAARYGERALVRYKKNGEVTDVSYNSFKYLVDSYGTQLVEMGVSTKHVALIGDNSYEWFLTYVTLLN
ncbi:MAG TPA: AMP-dependent synthetase, partial [Bacillota bacterium]|nr:AMP-dependent synthetase [Bacillota bacterium]